MIDFPDWLRKEMGEQGMTQADLARFSGLSSSMISLLFSGARGVGPEACRAIARALGYPPEVVFRAAGLLPPADERQAMDEEWGHVLGQLDDRDRDDLLAIARLKIEQAQKRKKTIQDQKGKYRPR